MPRQPVESQITGKISIKNDTNEPLGVDGTWEGEFEDVKDVAFLTVIVKSDKDSAPKGLKFQWSKDGENVHFEDTSDLGGTSGLSGRAFALTPRARYFRVVYVNGSMAQGNFLVGVVYHSSGTGIITRPLDRILTDNNFAQTVRSVIAGKKPDGEYANLLATVDGHLITQAVLYGVNDNGDIIPIKVTNTGRLRVKSD